MKKFASTLVFVMLMCGTALAAPAEPKAKADYTVDPKIQAVFKKLQADARIQKALAFIDADHANKLKELKEMVVLYGTPFKERELRSPMFQKKLEQYGAKDCVIDKHDNAFGWLRGSSGPVVVFEAHLDTVFPKDVPLKVTEKDGRIYCPGIADDTSGLANVLAVMRAIQHAGLKPKGSILVVGTSGEEGEGDLRGIKGLLDDHKNIAAVVSVEPGPAGAFTYGGIASRRYEFIFRGPGGHSWGAYGLPSPIHAMGRAIAKMSNVNTPADPKTTYTVGLVSGGTSVNSIALEARCKLDMRSLSDKALADTEKTMLALVDEAVAEDNAFRAKSGKTITVEKKMIGDRPGGVQPKEAPIVQAAYASITGVGAQPLFRAPGSTNANAPISRNIPAVCMRTGGASGNGHSHDEWFQPEGSQQGAKATLLMLFALTGLPGVTEPISLK